MKSHTHQIHSSQYLQFITIISPFFCLFHFIIYNIRLCFNFFFYNQETLKKLIHIFDYIDFLPFIITSKRLCFTFFLQIWDFSYYFALITVMYSFFSTQFNFFFTIVRFFFLHWSQQCTLLFIFLDYYSSFSTAFYFKFFYN